MKVKKKQRESGSVKINPEVYREVASFCDEQGLKVAVFVTKAASEKLSKEKERLTNQ